MAIEIKRFIGTEIASYINDLAQLRMKVFKEYPYLYEGQLEYEIKYLDTYLKCHNSVVVLVFDDKRIVGASTAVPLEFENDEITKPFLNQHLDIKKYFYLGESVLLPQYRGRNIYRHFFQQREQAAKDYGCTIATFAAVERPAKDARKPIGYTPLDNVWSHFGYQKHPELIAYLSWPEIGESSSTEKPLVFWLKELY